MIIAQMDSNQLQKVSSCGMERTSNLRKAWQNSRDSLFWMVTIAFLLRFAYILIAHSYRFKTADDNFGFGFETGRIGRALAQGQGFSNPFSGQTGPTAWEPPLYPFLIAWVFNLFGVYSKASAILLLSINSIFSALTCIPIFLIAGKCFDKKIGRWTGWLWVLLPSVMFWSTRWVWETSLATLLLAIIFWLTMILEERDGILLWIEFGVLWGVAALTNTSLLAFLPASGLWICYQRWRRAKSFLAGIALSAFLFATCIAPWLARDYRTFGQFIFIRSNFGAELRLGNGPGADGTWMAYLHPSQNAHQLRLYRQMGEMSYVAGRKREAVDFIRADYPRFAGLCLRRFVYYWSGVSRLGGNQNLAPLKYLTYLASSVLALLGLRRAVRKHRPEAWLFFWLIVCYPLVYYIVFPHPRYRHPIEPELGILIVYAISEIGKPAMPV
jgi:4-amino-4-deoxy-L-arabinose transferase-like glycosyltransferase